MVEDPGQAPDTELARIFDRGRTIRTTVICATILCGVITVTVGYVIGTKPAWLQLILGIAALLLGQSWVILILIRTRRHYVDKHHHRVVRLEKLLDEKRDSSTNDLDRNQGKDEGA